MKNNTITDEFVARLKADCSWNRDLHISAVMHPQSYGGFSIEALQEKDDKFRIACRYPRYLGEAYLFYADND